MRQQLKQRTIKKRKTPPSDYERYAKGFYNHHGDSLRNDPSERNFRRQLVEYSGEDVLENPELMNETKNRIQKYGIRIQSDTEVRPTRKKSQRSYSEFGYVKGRQVYAYRDSRGRLRDDSGKYASPSRSKFDVERDEMERERNPSKPKKQAKSKSKFDVDREEQERGMFE